MKNHFIIVIAAFFMAFAACKPTGSERPDWLFSDEAVAQADPIQGDSMHRETQNDNSRGDTVSKAGALTQPVQKNPVPHADTALGRKIVDFGKTLLGIPYKYASANPDEGFDCSGYLYYVYHNFGVDVPRSSKEYLDFGQTIDPREVKPGDFLLFTGTDSTIREPGHVGMVINNADGQDIEFIHASSGKAYGVTVSPLKGYYQTRFMRAIRIL